MPKDIVKSDIFVDTKITRQFKLNDGRLWIATVEMVNNAPSQTVKFDSFSIDVDVMEAIVTWARNPNA